MRQKCKQDTYSTKRYCLATHYTEDYQLFVQVNVYLTGNGDHYYCPVLQEKVLHCILLVGGKDQK